MQSLSPIFCILLCLSMAINMTVCSSNGSRGKVSRSSSRRLAAKEPSRHAASPNVSPSPAPSLAPLASGSRHRPSQQMLAPPSQRMNRQASKTKLEVENGLLVTAGVVSASLAGGHLAAGYTHCCSGRRKSGCLHCAQAGGYCLLTGCTAAALNHLNKD